MHSRALVLDPASAGLHEVLERRRRSGLDRFDEVWEGVLHMVPARSEAHGDLGSQMHVILRPLARAAGLKMTTEINIGESEEDYRVPDASLLPRGGGGVWHATAALVVEIVSPHDETWEKLPFYARHGVVEVVVVDPATRTVEWLGLDGGEYRPVERSGVVDFARAELAGGIEWPELEEPAE